MLHIFADALLIAARMEPARPDEQYVQPSHKSDARTRRRWFSLVGLRF